MPSRRVVVTSASDRRRYVYFQQDVGISDLQGGHAHNWQVVPGLSLVPITFRTWKAYERLAYQQLYPSTTMIAIMRYRRTVAVVAGMQMVYGNHVYRVHGAENYDQDNDAVQLFLEELQPTGSNR